MRYIVTYVVSKDDSATVTTTRAVIADNEENARKAFQSKRDNEIVSIQPADESMRMCCGLGWYTDQEEADIKRGLQDRYDRMRVESRKAFEDVSTMEPDEFAAHVAHIEARITQPTQNAEGIHIGDILEYSYGYDMTCWVFCQVVGLKGAHTIVVRENAMKSVDYAGGMGYQRPIRDRFRDDETYMVRTRIQTWPDGTKRLRAKAPQMDHNMELISGIGIREYNHND